MNHLKNTLKYIYFALGFLLGYQLGEYVIKLEWYKNIFGENVSEATSSAVSCIIFGICFGIIFIILIPALTRAFERFSLDWLDEVRKTSPLLMVVRVVVLIVALLLASLICTPVYKLNINDVIKTLIIILVYVALVYFSMLLVTNMGGDIENMLGGYFAKAKTEREDGKTARSLKKKSAVIPKILDTSVIIDGRIFDILSTGFIDGPIIIPTFVVDELQFIADSSDPIKRNRGRNGLDLLNRMQKELSVEVSLVDKDYDDISEVDSKLIRLAKDMKGKVITNDYNLNKVAEIHGVKVLNMNDLSNTVKTVVLPGEIITVHVLKEGKENNQGVAYLDDGTMIVVENGKDFIGKNIKANVTSVLQTSAGRLVFVKPEH